MTENTPKTRFFGKAGCATKTIAGLFVLAIAGTSSWASSEQLVSAATIATAVQTATVNAARKSIAAAYPATRFDSIRPTPVAGIYEVKMGKNIAYVTADGRYWFFGALFDMPKLTDLTLAARNHFGIGQTGAGTTAAPAVSAPPGVVGLDGKINVKAFPLADAFVRVQGNGKRKLYLFSDTDCPYCHRVEATLAKLKNVTIYTFMVPIVGNGADGELVWCAKNRVAAWNALMERGIRPKEAVCHNPLQRNLALATKVGLRATPTMFNERGEMMAGAQPIENIQALLGD